MRTLTAISIFAALVAAGAAPSTSRATSAGRNGLIVYGAQMTAVDQLFTIRPDGTANRQLTDLPGGASNPDWAPDGSEVVFQTGGGDHGGISLLNADGSGLRELTPTGLQGQPSFSPDGT